jgi:hypothetical protein
MPADVARLQQAETFNRKDSESPKKSSVLLGFCVFAVDFDLKAAIQMVVNLASETVRREAAVG